LTFRRHASCASVVGRACLTNSLRPIKK